MFDPDTLANTVLWFERAVPQPTNKNLHTQLGCHLEEVVEMLECLHSESNSTTMMIHDAEEALKALSDHLKQSENVVYIPVRSQVDMLDALCDQTVTAAGVAHMLDFQFLPALEKVNTSNWSKFINGAPVFDENRKIRKGPDYHKANLEPYVPLAVS